MLSKVPSYSGTVKLCVPNVAIEPVPPLVIPAKTLNANTALPVPPALSPTKT
jgi:hypothetical protein